MMKKLLIAMAAALALAGCGNSAAAEPPVLTGDWTQSNSNADDFYQIATITDDTIEVYWYSTEDSTKALYWAGTFVAPETADEPYSWESVNDTEKTGSALLASGDDTKTFTYEDGQISYEVGAMSVTTTAILEKDAE